MFSSEGTAFLEKEAKHLWNLQHELSAIKRQFCRSGAGSDDLYDELDLVVEMSEHPTIVRRARAMMRDINATWPRLGRVG